MLDLGQRFKIELTGEQLAGDLVAEILANRDDEGVLGEEGTGELGADLLVCMKETSSIDKRLVALSSPQRSAGADHQTLFHAVLEISDAEGVASSVDEGIMLYLLGGRVASDKEIFVDLFRSVSG